MLIAYYLLPIADCRLPIDFFSYFVSLKQLQLEYLLFVVFLVFFSLLVTQLPFFKKTGLSKSQLVILFLLKVIAGMFYGWIGIYYGSYAQMVDTWSYHYQAIDEYKLLGTQPYEYFTNLFHNPYPGGILNFFGSTDSYWNDLKSNIFIKLLSIFDIFSFGNYYINVIFYCFLSYIGPIAFYRVITDVYPNHKSKILLATFLIPSFFYWTSGIHKEGLIFVGISLVIYHVYFGSKEKRWGWNRWVGILTGLLIFLLLRNFILVIMFPALLAWVMANRWPAYCAKCFAGLYIFFCILFFTLRYINPKFDFPQAVVDKQQAFIGTIGGNTSIPIKQLKPTVVSFITNIPQAITLSAVRPYPKDIHHLLSMAAALEIGAILSIFLLFIFFHKKSKEATPPVIYFCLYFSLSLLLAIGFSVNNLGAIVRYRSIIFPLIIVILIINIDWKRLESLISPNIIKNNNQKDF